jgi:hypothetical protein
MLHGGTEIAGFRAKSYENLQAMASETGTVHRKINGLVLIQRELPIFNAM